MDLALVKSLHRKFGHQEVLIAPLLQQLNTLVKLLKVLTLTIIVHSNEYRQNSSARTFGKYYWRVYGINTK